MGGVPIMDYRTEMSSAMKLLGEHPKTLFIGQGTLYKGHGMFSTLKDVPDSRKIEFPVAEEFQLGLGIGLSLQGYIPVLLYPRFDFLILAMNQLINHLDKIEVLSDGEFKPKVIIRVSVGSKTPLNPGLQHVGDYTEALESMLTSVQIVKLEEPKDVFRFYNAALNDAVKLSKSTILVEYGELYDNVSTR
jgi:pyruvate/2-oxoglutarate/acetoin dehydrogenase E1 component